jgi:hypothetical protein
LLTEHIFEQLVLRLQIVGDIRPADVSIILAPAIAHPAYEHGDSDDQNDNVENPDH